jgi:hypothetical protein
MYISVPGPGQLFFRVQFSIINLHQSDLVCFDSNMDMLISCGDFMLVTKPYGFHDMTTDSQQH